MTTIERTVNQALHTADAEDRLAAADAAFAISFVSLDSAAQARTWRGLDHGAKFRLVCRRIEALGMSWMPSVVEEQIAKYDDRFALGPVEAAVEGALERLAIDNGQSAAMADKSDRAYFRRNATAFTNALIQYHKGVRPERLSSRAYLLPSSRAGEPPHLVTLDGDWTCSCPAQHSMHWPIALIVALEIANDDMERFGDPPFEDNPLGSDEGDEVPSSRTFGQRIAECRRAYDYAA